MHAPVNTPSSDHELNIRLSTRINRLNEESEGSSLSDSDHAPHEPARRSGFHQRPRVFGAPADTFPIETPAHCE